MSEINYEKARKDMLERLIDRGIQDMKVLGAFGEVQRENYVPVELLTMAYDDTPIPLGERSLLQHPWIIAYMLESLDIREHDRVLEIGTGSGYQAALLGRLASSVITLEPSKRMAMTALLRLRTDSRNVRVYTGSVKEGFPAFAPYDVIMCNLSVKDIPEHLMAQLKVGGRMIFPLKEDVYEQLMKVTRSDDGFVHEGLLKLQYIPVQGSSRKKKNNPPRQGRANSTSLDSSAENGEDV